MPDHRRRLPIKQLVILSICRFGEPIALTSIFPYVPEMMESFGVPANDIPSWAGYAAATFSICQAFTGIPWGAASDRYGRKPIILIGLCNTMITMLMWGFSTNLPMAIAARALQGLGNGNVGILRTTVAELCPWKELQPRAFSIMPIVYTIGSIFGPTIGGALANPLGVDPRGPHGTRFFERYPYSPPNLVGAVLFSIGIVTGWLFLKESLESKKHERDLGLVVGAKITVTFRRIFNVPSKGKELSAEQEPLLGQSKNPRYDEPAPKTSQDTAIEPPPKIRDVLNHQVALNMFVYFLLAFYSLAYDQLLPVFMHHRTQPIDDPNVSLPWKFAGGFGIDSGRIGAIFTVLALASTFSQFVIFPPLARWLGVLRCMRLSFLVFPVVYAVTPFISLLPDQRSKEVAMAALLAFRGISGCFAFPCSTIMITNSASSLRVLGTINGLATSVSAIGRAVGPAAGGYLFSWGLKEGYVIVPFWALSVIALIAWVATFWLVEGKGFGDDPDSDVESVASASSASSASYDETEETIALGAHETDTILSESEYGEPTSLLSRATTRSSQAVGSDDGLDYDSEIHVPGDRPRRRTEQSLSRMRSRSQSRRPHRRSSIPIGMGQGFRRLSSNLGSTGFGAGGASWGGT